MEAQHQIATRALVDSAAEQDVLERLLEESKPPLPEAAGGLHYLLFTPFRYDPRRPGSRFRRWGDPGVFYAADEVRTACAELGYWRWRFLMDAPAVSVIEARAQTVFKVAIRTVVVDLRRRPFVRDRAAWTDPSSYDATQAFATVAREAEIGAIRYQSVRDPQHGGCAALLTPRAFAEPAPLEEQTWWLSVTRERVSWRRKGIVPGAFEFEAEALGGDAPRA